MLFNVSSFSHLCSLFSSLSLSICLRRQRATNQTVSAATANPPWQDADSGSADWCEMSLGCCLFFASCLLQGRRASRVFSFSVCANPISAALLWIPDHYYASWEICAIVRRDFTQWVSCLGTWTGTEACKASGGVRSLAGWGQNIGLTAVYAFGHSEARKRLTCVAHCDHTTATTYYPTNQREHLQITIYLFSKKVK